MKRKILKVFVSLSVILCFLLSGCAGSQDAAKPSKEKTTPQQEASSPVVPTAEEKEIEPANKPEEIGDRLAKTYNDLMASGKYFMKYRMTTDGETITAEIAYDGDDIATKTIAGGIENRMIIKDNKMYMIDPIEKKIIIMNSEAYEDEGDDVDYGGLLFVKDGQEDFLGKSLPYEEYSIEGITIKYFFEGKKLVGMEMNYEGMVEVLEILELDRNIPSGMFDIPKDYEQQSLG